MEFKGTDLSALTTDFDQAMKELVWDAEDHVEVKNLITRHTVSRILSEIALEKELPFHFEKGVTYHCISKGNIDSLSYMRFVVRQQKIKYALLSTWAMAVSDVQEIRSWLEKGIVKRFDFYVGENLKYPANFPQYNLMIETCKKYGGRVCLLRNHSKTAIFFGEKFDVVIESSANCNTNPRIEETVITMDTDLALFYKKFWDEQKSFDNDFDDVQPMEL